MLFFTTVSPALVKVSLRGKYNEKFVGQLECSFLGGRGNKVQWLRGDLLLENKTDNILNIEGVETGEMYTCTVSNLAGNSSDVRTIPPLVTLHPSHKQATVKESVIFCCNITSYPSPLYEWRKNKGPLPVSAQNSNTSCLTVSHVEFGDEGRYFCVGTSNNTRATSKRAILTGKWPCYCGLQNNIIVCILCDQSLQSLQREV